jgi:hypothetical protein
MRYCAVYVIFAQIKGNTIDIETMPKALNGCAWIR